MMPWRYYLKMLRYEQFMVPAAMIALCLLVIVLMKLLPPGPIDPLPAIVLAFIEGALPLATALIGTSLFFGDPARELHYTVVRPLWRTLVERLALLVVLMTGFYTAFVLIARLLNVTLTGWSVTPSALLVWLVPAVAWSGLAYLLAALFRSGTAANGLVAVLWIIGFLLHSAALGSPLLRVVYPFLTVFEPESLDWTINRAALLVIGVVGLTAGLLLLRHGEKYFSAEAS